MSLQIPSSQLTFSSSTFGVLLHPHIYSMIYCHGWLKCGWESISKWQSLQYCKFIMPKMFCKEWKIMLGLHLVLVTRHGQLTFSIKQVMVTLHGWFTISIEQTSRNGGTIGDMLDRTTCWRHANHSRLNNQHDWRELCDHLMSTRILTLVRNKSSNSYETNGDRHDLDLLITLLQLHAFMCFMSFEKAGAERKKVSIWGSFAWFV